MGVRDGGNEVDRGGAGFVHIPGLIRGLVRVRIEGF